MKKQISITLGATYTVVILVLILIILSLFGTIFYDIWFLVIKVLIFSNILLRLIGKNYENFKTTMPPYLFITITLSFIHPLVSYLKYNSVINFDGILYTTSLALPIFIVWYLKHKNVWIGIYFKRHVTLDILQEAKDKEPKLWSL